LKGFGDVPWHGERDSAIGFIKLNAKAEVLSAGPIDGDGVKGLKRADEMLCTLFSGVFYSKVIDDKSEHGAVGIVSKEACCVGLVITMLS
jgi:hypothetical protein